jgi:glucose-1-phosphate thymidylyltransferase
MTSTQPSPRKGIVLAGGSGSRLHPMTAVASKQLLPVYDKPMIYYPLSILMLAGIQDILIISTPHDLPRFKELLGDGSMYGIRLSYVVQPRPEGLAQAFLVGADFVGRDPVTLILGDNIFYGRLDFLWEAAEGKPGATIFGYYVQDPERYGVVEVDANFKAISLEEKPKAPKSNWAIPGLYFYDENVVELARQVKPSPRGELEITDLNRLYMEKGLLNVVQIGRGVAWLDTGTPESLLDAGNFISQIERRQGLKIACLEEIALRRGFLSLAEYDRVVAQHPKSPFRSYLERIRGEFA